MLLYVLQDVILERKKKTKKIDLSRLKVATKSKSQLQQVRHGRSGRIREKSWLSKPTHGRSSCSNTITRFPSFSVVPLVIRLTLGRYSTCTLVSSSMLQR